MRPYFASLVCMSVTVVLPRAFRLHALGPFTSEIIGAHGLPKSDEIIFDFERLDFIDGTGYTVLSNTISWLISNGVACKFKNFKNANSNAMSYLDDCGFFRAYIGYSLSWNSKVRTSTIPCISVSHAGAHGWINSSLSPFLCKAFRVNYFQLSNVRTCVKEIFNNIQDRSLENTGFVHVQHYPGVHKVNITISDFGQGIPATIKRQFGDMDDGCAIERATEEGVTSKSTPRNQGIGLAYLLDVMCKNQGTTIIQSSNGSYRCDCDRGRSLIKKNYNKGFYPGTLIDLQFDTRLFSLDEDEVGTVEW